MMTENDMLVLIIGLLILLLIMVLVAAAKSNSNSKGKITTDLHKDPISTDGEVQVLTDFGGSSPEPEDRKKSSKGKDLEIMKADEGHQIRKIYVDRHKSGLIICPNCEAENLIGETSCISCNYHL